jgi:hypothetical protein
MLPIKYVRNSVFHWCILVTVENFFVRSWIGEELLKTRDEGYVTEHSSRMVGTRNPARLRTLGALLQVFVVTDIRNTGIDAAIIPLRCNSRQNCYFMGNNVQRRDFHAVLKCVPHLVECSTGQLRKDMQFECLDIIEVFHRNSLTCIS